MIRDLIQDGFSTEILIDLMSTLFVVFFSLPVHEYAHAWMATRLGDQTPRLAGRLTLNPLRHLDVIGTILIFVVGFGYAKPVMVNPRNFKDSRKGMALTAAAGPAVNLLMAVMFMILSNVAWLFTKAGAVVSPADVAVAFFTQAAWINVCLAVFNLLPIPPLDGSRILGLLLPRDAYFKVMQYEQYMLYGLYALLFFNVLTVPLSWLSNLVFDGLDFIFFLPFRLFA